MRAYGMLAHNFNVHNDGLLPHQAVNFKRMFEVLKRDNFLIVVSYQVFAFIPCLIIDERRRGRGGFDLAHCFKVRPSYSALRISRNDLFKLMSSGKSNLNVIFMYSSI